MRSDASAKSRRPRLRASVETARDRSGPLRHGIGYRRRQVLARRPGPQTSRWVSGPAVPIGERETGCNAIPPQQQDVDVAMRPLLRLFRRQRLPRLQMLACHGQLNGKPGLLGRAAASLRSSCYAREIRFTALAGRASSRSDAAANRCARSGAIKEDNASCALRQTGRAFFSRIAPVSVNQAILRR